MTSEEYLHLESDVEAERLAAQARLLEASIYQKIDFGATRSLLEVGCGVGAQTAIMLRLFPKLKVHAVDYSENQLARARQNLGDVVGKRVFLQQASAASLPFNDASFDGAFTCWLLEHTKTPETFLREIHRVLEKGGLLFCNEPVNTQFHLEPYCPATLKYRQSFTDYHWDNTGDPFVGIKLGNLLRNTGFVDVETWPVTHLYDDREPEKRAAFVDYWRHLLLSAAPLLLNAGVVTQADVREMNEELDRVKATQGSVIMDTWMQAKARAG